MYTTKMDTPSTLIFESTDPARLSKKMLAVFLKNLFRYGRKEVKIVNKRVHLYLKYSPKNQTIQGKLKNLPVRYLRVAADDEEELQLLLKGMREFSDVNFYAAAIEQDEPVPAKKFKPASEEEKIKILENRILKSATTTTTTTTTPTTSKVEDFCFILNDDADEFESQTFSVVSK
ncbi:uncharacterized protein LOC132699984 [Cylas formicarius]|uniref:uncharacterized protein LOC132699984 n=1 Tax=Cylas formicarius TaxID=197179 RepID=UPI00295844AA|nr:uncharacterized protein LOC132699984 [Cylas formicarius]